MLNIKILESDRQIAALINKGLASAFDKTIKQNVPALRTKMRSIIAGALYNSHEIRSLSGGTLMADFGLTSDPSHNIVSSVVSSMAITTPSFRLVFCYGGRSRFRTIQDRLHALGNGRLGQGVTGGGAGNEQEKQDH